ncbi:hypothetical protein V1503_07785 [Bacillus sp. SCS-151]|uniref:hypothetical protein n=1 Tax=Nanhaiella sioensis TaxID=3115293 RepID=UPI00397DD24C
MKEEIINFYKIELGVWNMVYKYMNRLALIIYILVFLLLIVLLVNLLLNQNTFWSLLVILLFLLEGAILNQHNKKIFEKAHKIPKKKQGIMWGGLYLNKRRYEKLELFVLRELDSKQQLEKLIDILNKESDSRKFSGLFIRGLGVGLFLPLWNFFVKWIFDNGIDNLNMAIGLFVIFVVLIFVIILFTSMTKLIVLDFFDRESTRINDLATMLEDISLKDLNFNKKISQLV